MSKAPSLPPPGVVRFLRGLRAGQSQAIGTPTAIRQWVRRRGLARTTTKGGPTPRWEITDEGVMFLKVQQ